MECFAKVLACNYAYIPQSILFNKNMRIFELRLENSAERKSIPAHRNYALFLRPHYPASTFLASHAHESLATSKSNSQPFLSATAI